MKCLGKWNEIHFILLPRYFILFPALFHNLLFHSLPGLFHFISSLSYFIILPVLFHYFASLISLFCQADFIILPELIAFHFWLGLFHCFARFISLFWQSLFHYFAIFKVRVRQFFFFWASSFHYVPKGFS